MSRKKKKQQKGKSSPSKRSTKRNILLDRFRADVDRKLEAAVKYHRSGELQKAGKICKKILKITPNHPEALHLLGLIAYHVGNRDAGIAFINKAIQNDPENSVYYNNFGNALKDQGRLDEAISCYQKALQLRPDYFAAYNDMGNAFRDQGKLSEAISCFQMAVQLRPNYFGAYTNMGNAFQDQGKLSEAISCFQKAVKIKPDYPEAYNNMGNAFQDQGKPSEAISCFQKALQLKPDFAEPFVQLVRGLQLTCEWEKLRGLRARLDELTRKALDNGAKPAESPFFNLTRHADPSGNSEVARSWSSDIARHVANLNIDFLFNGRSSGKTKITVAYLSNDFYNHATAHLMLSLFGLHNRDEFEILCYSYGKDDGSYYRKRIQQDCDQFVDLCNLTQVDAAKRIYEERTDILVDLKGYTQGSRLAICALRPAPIQVTYLGFPGTTGADFFDYIITDRIVTPEGHAPYYSENFVYLPHCYQVNDHTQSLSDKDFKKADFGLPAASFLFSSFNQPYKIDPVMFDVWMKILHQVSEAVLWLQYGNETAERNLKREAEARGIKAERLVFVDKLPKDEHLARLRLADLALDTRIVNGHTTTSDALWTGVPVITLKGSHFASRVSASILTAVGLPELVARSLEEYQALAVRLARNQGELKALRQKLAKKRFTESLFDTPRFVKNLERAYKEMWEIFLAGERPRQIDLSLSEEDRNSRSK
jgi:protein O-GlcNAc transferase